MRFAASMWIYTKADVCNGPKHMQDFRVNKVNSIMEAVNWVCDDSLDNHFWVSQATMALQEAKSSGGAAIRHRNPLRGAVRDAVVLSTNQPQQGPVEWW